MQRSRRALLQRRAVAATALERKGNTGSKRLSYKVSLSLVLLLWGLVFLLNFLISHGNGYRDELDVEPNDSYWHETQLDPIKSSNSKEPSDPCATNSNEALQNTPFLEEKSVIREELVTDVDKSSSTTIEEDEAAREILNSGSNAEKETRVKNDRISHVAPGLDEFKSRAIAAKEKPSPSQTNTVIHRLEPGGAEYNYASAKKGAKVLDSNKEAKGASNILDKDKDKYLRNPCSVEDKHVVIELSEETLVDTIVIGNFEHYSSNLKDFEIYSSFVYPTDSWTKLGNFTAQNVKHAQRFYLPEPKWARYLKLHMLSHYGSEFYCTLSVVEVYGVDVVERMLEDLIAVENKDTKRVSDSEEQVTERVPQKEPSDGNEQSYQDFLEEISEELPQESMPPKKEAAKNSASDTVSDSRPTQIGRMPGDNVLKILLQKVQTLDLNFSVLEKYLEELNSRYAHVFKDFDDDMSNKETILEKIKFQIKNLQDSRDTFAKEIGEFQSWKSLVSLQLEQLAKDNIELRSEFKRVRDHQVDIENRSFVVIFMCFLFGGLAAAKMFLGIFLSIFRTQNSTDFFCNTISAWFFLLLSSSIIAFILVI